MMLHKYSAVVQSYLLLLHGSDIRVLTWMAMNAQFKNGLLIASRNAISEGTGVSVAHLERVFPKLQRLGLIKKEKKRHYRVNLVYPSGRNGIKLPAVPMLPKE